MPTNPPAPGGPRPRIALVDYGAGNLRSVAKALERSELEAPADWTSMPELPQRDRILILDYGSQFTQLIARRVREQQVYCEIHPPTLDRAAVEAFAPAGIVLSGGPSSVHEPGAPGIAAQILDLGIPVLGICYGMHLMAHHTGGAVRKWDKGEFGLAFIDLELPHPLFDGIEAIEVTRTRFWEGWGIHYTSRGWLYNVSGYGAVLIHLKSGKRFMLGTDEPASLAAALGQRIA